MHSPPTLATLLGLLLAGCAGDEADHGGGGDIGGGRDDTGGGDEGGGGSDDDSGGGDEAGGGDPSQPELPAGCPQVTLGEVTLLEPEAHVGTAPGGTFRSLDAGIDAATEFELELWDGFGAFGEDVAAPGVYEIEADEAALTTCGVCVSVFIDDDRWFLATDGLVTLESVDGRMTGQAAGLTLHELGEGAIVHEGACWIQIDSVSFDTPYTPNEEEQEPPA